MSFFSRRRPSTPTVLSTWTWTVARLVVLMVAVGAVAIAAIQYQRASFAATTSHVEEAMLASVELRKTFLDTVEPVSGVLYFIGGLEQRDAKQQAFASAHARMLSAFDRGEAIAEGGEREALRQARDAWMRVHAGVVASDEQWKDGTARAVAAQRQDPFRESVWEPHRDVSLRLAESASESVEDLQARAEELDRVQRLIPAAVAIAVVVALFLSWLTALRMSRRVVGPILDLQRAAAELRETDGATDVELPAASAELRELASTLNETAAALRISHGRLRDQANTDALTALPNRTSFAEELERLLAVDEPGRVAVLFVDLDDFKVVNDSMGHAAGDALLRIVAERLRSTSRGDELVARLGGDEFALALRAEDPAAGVAVAERVLATLEEPVILDGHAIRVACSIGVAIGPDGPGVDASDDLVRNADFAMYMAKSRGKSCYEVFAPSMHSEMLARMELKRDLSQALRLDQFAVVYQPAVDLASGYVLGFEALVRWHHPGRGLVPPVEFIGLAEDTGDIVEIGAWVLDRACSDLARELAPAGAAGPRWVSVNVSAVQLEAPGFVEMVIETLRRRDVDPTAIVLEITEAVALTNSKAAAGALAQLRDLGVHVALDDFGVGFSSLRYLHELPVDVIKIDRSFVTSRDAKTESVLDAIVTLSQRLGLDVIAEGIEEVDELVRLQRFDGLGGQGYLFARPMPVGEAAIYAEGREAFAAR